jgi:hypothetical protein
MQVLKQRTARTLLPKRKRRDPRQHRLFGDELQPRAFWQARFYDFNVRTTKKRVEKLRYMHRNPVNRGLVESPDQWRWSSYRFYALGEAGLVQVNVGWGEISFRKRAARPVVSKSLYCKRSWCPPLQKAQERGTQSCGNASGKGRATRHKQPSNCYIYIV